MNKFPPIPKNTEIIGRTCLDSAYKVHSLLGPGLLESVYQKALLHEVTKRDLNAKPQAPVNISYDGQDLGTGLYCDILVENAVILELKSVENLLPLYEAQLLTYLKLTNIRLGFLINFNVSHLKTGIKRLVLW